MSHRCNLAEKRIVDAGWHGGRGRLVQLNVVSDHSTFFCPFSHAMQACHASGVPADFPFPAPPPPPRDLDTLTWPTGLPTGPAPLGYLYLSREG